MPVHLKIIVSVLALLVSTAVFFLDMQAGTEGGASRWIALALGPFMVFGIWVFPEPKHKDIRREAARRR